MKEHEYQADLENRVRLAVEHNNGVPYAAWSTGERLAVALVLQDEEYLTAENETVATVLSRIAGDIHGSVSAAEDLIRRARTWRNRLDAIEFQVGEDLDAIENSVGPGMNEEEFNLHADVLTVGQLRAQLAEWPDDMPVHVSTIEEPGSDIANPDQVVTGVERIVGLYGTPGHYEERPDTHVTIMCNWPSGTYTRSVAE